MSTMTDYRTARRDDKRLDEELKRNAEAQRRQEDREDKRAAAEQKRLDDEAERNRRKQEKKDRDKERARKAKERRDRWAQRINAVPGWFSKHLDLAAALTVMACSIVPALASQSSSLKDTGIDIAMGKLGLVLVVLLPVMLECSAWAATAGEAKAMEQSRNPWPYRIAIYSFAGLAAWVNYLHGSHVGGEKYGLLLGSVLAASSIVPIVVWQLVQLGRHREARAKLAADRKSRRDAKKTRGERKQELPEVWKTTKRLRAIAGHGTLSEDEAWTAAYAVHEGVGDTLSSDHMAWLSADMLGLRVDAEERLAEILGELRAANGRRLKAAGISLPESAETTSVESVSGSVKGVVTPSTGAGNRSLQRLAERKRRSASAQINSSVPASTRTSTTAPVRTRDTTSTSPRRASRKNPLRTLSEGAKKAAAQSAKTASADENSTIEQWIADQLRAGKDVKRADIETETMRLRVELHGPRKAAKFGTPSRTWCYDRLAAARKHHGLHVVPERKTA